jgi:hypothetical protein
MDAGVLETIILSVLVAAVVLALRPATALGVIMASALLWPEYLRIPMGVAQMSVPRIAAVFLFARLLVAPGSNPPRWRLPDTLVVALYLWYVLANILAGTSDSAFRTIVGSGFDTVLMYLIARRACADPIDVGGVLKGLAVSGLVLSPLGLAENITRWSPYAHYLEQQHGEEFQGGGSDMRLGMRRAFVSTLQPIFFGMAMLMVTGIIFSLRGQFKKKLGYWVAIGTAALATLTSLSSGPWIGLILLACVNALYWRRQLIKPAIIGLVGAMAAMEALSNRHFYHLIDYLALDSGTSWYRSRLMEVAVNHLGEYWGLGCGGRGVEHWGPEIDGRSMVDMVNNYVIAAYTGGVPAMLLYIAIKISVLACLVKTFKQGSPAMRPVAFGLAALLVGLSASELSVGLYGPAQLFSYILMGLAVSTRDWVDLLDSRKRRALAMKPKLEVPSSIEAPAKEPA